MHSQQNVTVLFIADCICSHKNTVLSHDIITFHRIYRVTQRRRNNCLIYFNLKVLWKCNFNSLTVKNVCNLARHEFLNLRENDTEMSKHVGVIIV